MGAGHGPYAQQGLGRQPRRHRASHLDGDERLVNTLNTIFGSSDELCDIELSPEGDEIEECDIIEGENTPEAIQVDLTEGTDRLISDLLEELTPEMQIQDTNQLTYRINPRSVCETEGVEEGDFATPIPSPDFIPEDQEQEETP